MKHYTLHFIIVKRPPVVAKPHRLSPECLIAQTIKDKYPILCIDDFISDLHNTKIFSHVDLIKAYHQIPINPGRYSQNSHR